MGEKPAGGAGWYDRYSDSFINEPLYAGLCWLEHGYSLHKSLQSYDSLIWVDERFILEGTPRQIIFQLRKLDREKLEKLVELIEGNYQKECGYIFGILHRSSGQEAIDFIQQVLKEKQHSELEVMKIAANAVGQEAKPKNKKPRGLTGFYCDKIMQQSEPIRTEMLSKQSGHTRFSQFSIDWYIEYKQKNKYVAKYFESAFSNAKRWCRSMLGIIEN